MKSMVKGYNESFILIIFVVFTFLNLIHISTANERLMKEAESLFKAGIYL